MPRKRRICLAGEVHHVMSRGLDGTSLFLDDEDRAVFLELCHTNLKKFPFTCYAWCLMDTHFHLLLRLPHGEEFRYFKERIRYIHLNPLRTGAVSSLSDLAHYPRCGHGAIMGKQQAPPIQSVEKALSRFGTYRSAARKAYDEYMKKGVESSEGEELSGYLSGIRPYGKRSSRATFTADFMEMGDGRIVGEAEFVRTIMKKYEKERIAHSNRMKKRPGLQQIKHDIEKKIGVVEGSLLNRGRSSPLSIARAESCYRANRENGYTQEETGCFLGLTSGSVSRAVERSGLPLMQ
jgi:hypothetical protein